MPVKRTLVLLATLLTLAWLIPAPVQAQKPARAKQYDINRDRVEYLDNGTLRLGADLDLGGAITYLADSKTRDSVINNFDWGRQVQLSYYSGPVPYTPGGKQPKANWRQLGWNPIQVGDAFGHRSRILESRNDGRTIYIRCIPMHWPLENVPGECTFETTITLEQNTARVRTRLQNIRTDDKTQYPGRNQELPAVYTNGPYWRLLTYTGARPFSGDALTTIPTTGGAGFPWHSWRATEHWAALVRDDGWGLGVFNPDTIAFSGGFAGKTGKGGSLDNPTGYIAPNHREILDYNIQYDFEFTLILGSLEQIRTYAAAHAPRPAPPRYVFASDRQHWVYTNASDAGWPVAGELKIALSQNDPQMMAPEGLWPAAAAPKLFIRAAYHAAPGQKGELFWKKLVPAPRQRPAKTKTKAKANRIGDFDGHTTFDVIPDGQYHTYEIPLAGAPGYDGMISGLRFDPVTAGHAGDWIKVKWISSSKLDEK